MAETKFERHRQPWRQDEIQKLHLLAGKGQSLRAIAKALTRSEESVKERAKADRLKITKLRSLFHATVRRTKCPRTGTPASASYDHNGRIAPKGSK